MNGRVYPRTPVLARLVRKLNRDGPIAEGMTTPCWLFEGGTTSKGHGRIRDDAGALSLPHRIALAAALGRPIRDGFMVGHICDVKRCCRPTHLYEASQSENERDKHYFAERVARGDTIFGIDRHTDEVLSA